jgi:DNA-binding response OmpR family regulator
MSSTKRIALIEDDSSIREMYKIKLKLSGYDVVTAEDGKRGLELVEKEKPDLVLLNILLPKKDGFEVLGEIAKSKDDKIKSIPVIIISNLSNEEDINEAKRLGASDYLVRAQINPKDVVEKVSDFFSEAR